MKRDVYENYLNLLREELIPAMGCTEPIAIAYAAATARVYLGTMPERMIVRCSGNIIKNVKGVNVPNAGGQKGVETAALLGALAGDAEKKLQVISAVPAGAAEEVRRLREQGICTCELAEGVGNLFIRIEAAAGDAQVVTEIRGRHDHISRIEKNGEVLLEAEERPAEHRGDKSQLNLRDIFEFAGTAAIEDIAPLMERQIAANTAISQEGLRGDWGASVGKNLLGIAGDSLMMQAAARAAAGSDARMNGCALPVVINSGSGNQGITCTLPVVTYAEALGLGQDRLYRALALTNLIAMHQKRYIGNLSAFCGAVSAGAAAACGIAFLQDADFDVIGKTLINTLGNTGGIVCDGAKSSCAAKIASAVSAGILGYEMAKRDAVFPFGEGLVETDYEQTIRNYGRLAKEGMKATDIEILNMMIGK